VGHGGVPAIRAGGVQGDLEDAGQEGNVADNVRDNVQTAGGDTDKKANAAKAAFTWFNGPRLFWLGGGVGGKGL
jgi:hypothetical protein